MRLDYKGSQPVDASRSVSSVQQFNLGGCYVQIDKQTSDGTTTVFDFQNIPQTYSDLRMRIMGTLDIGAGGTGALYMQFNGDSGANYRATHVNWFNSVAPLVIPEIDVDDVDPDIGFDLPGPNFSGFAFPTAPGICEMLIAEYANTGFWKVAQGLGGGLVTNSDGSLFGGEFSFRHGYWMNSEAVANIQVGTISELGGGGGAEVFVAGTTCTLHGIC